MKKSIKKYNQAAKIVLYLAIFLFFLVILFSHVGNKRHTLDTPQNTKETSIQNISKKTVLYISSYSPSFKTFFQQVEGIQSQFEDLNIILDIEYMDTKRFYTDENITNFYNSLSYKIKNLSPYDAIIVADDNALNFVMKYKRELFNKIPIIFIGINNIENAMMLSEDPYVTGIVEVPSIAETIEIAAKLNNKATNVVAIVDNTNSGQADLVAYYAQEENMPNLTFKEMNLSNLDYNEFASALQQLDEQDIVLLLSAYSDKTKKTITFDEGLSLVVDNCSQPIYHPYYHGLGYGILGGKVISHYEEGSRAAAIVIDIFSGKDVSQIKCEVDDSKEYIFDYNIINKYAINEELIPEEAVLLNKPQSIFQIYRNYVLSAIGILTVQLLIIFFLIHSIKEKNEVERDLLESNQSVMEMNKELKNANTALNENYEQIRVKNKQIKELVYIDSLTGLNNRFSMFEIIDQVINCEIIEGTMAVLFLDLDNFKNINDTHGHDIGDQVLEVIGKKLKQLQDIDDNIEIGRFGGDEFLFIIKNNNQMQQIIDCVEKIQNLIREPIVTENEKFCITSSMGIALIAKDDNRKELIKKADLALYRAKKLGKNTYVFYNNTIGIALNEKINLQKAIVEATFNKEFVMYYQPYVDAKTHKVVGVEALIRWFSKEHANISPFKLIKNAEEMGLIIKIGQWVIETACNFAKKINQNRENKLTVSINISAIQLMDNGFCEKITRTIEEIGVSPEYICLEMTETILIESIENGINVIEQLKHYGFKIAIDDFGTGYSSLKYFEKLPINVIKIDKSFVDNIETSEYDGNFIDFIANIAHFINIKVTVEGVERQKQLQIVEEKGCDTIQGYVFSKPLSENEVIEFINGQI